MVNFVLVHGAWHGAWCWSRVIPELRKAGHAAHAVTLTGVGERAHLLSKNISLQTHINDVLGLIEAEELHNVVLVLHSYAGVVGTGVADKLGSARIRHICYVDAVLPKPGEAWGRAHSQATLEQRLTAAAATPRTYVSCTQPASPTIDPMRTRTVDAQFWGGAWLPQSRCIEVATGHDIMVSAAADLNHILLECAA